MSKTRTIELSEPIRDHCGQIKTIVLREPRYSDFIDIGAPATWVSLGNGGFSQETPAVLGQWIERLADIDPNLLPQLSLRDTLELRAAVFEFFYEAGQMHPAADDQPFSGRVLQ
jgi:hypothetical protein